MFDWDEHNRDHIAAHGITPSEAEEVIVNSPVDLEMQLRNGEERYLQIGETDSGRILLVVSTWRSEKIRVITAFPASSKLKAFYLANKGADDEDR